jgi:hypothetical protein
MACGHKLLLKQHDHAKLLYLAWAGKKGFFFAKNFEANALNQHELAEHYIELGWNIDDVTNDVLERVSARLSDRGLFEAAGLTLPIYQFTCGGDWCSANGVDSLRILMCHARNLIDGGDEDRLLGYLLIGQFLPYAKVLAKLGSRVCKVCFRHRDWWRSAYCKEHSRASANSNWQKTRDQFQKRRMLLESAYDEEIMYFIDSSRGPSEPWDAMLSSAEVAIWHENTACAKVSTIVDYESWGDISGLYQPQPPLDWRTRVSVWENLYPWLPKALTELTSWADVVRMLRTKYVLNDGYCISEDFKLWEAKLQARNAEKIAGNELMLVDKRRQPRSPLRPRIAELAKDNPALSQIEAAKLLKGEYTESAVYKCISRNPDLRGFFKRASGVNLA